MKYIWQIILVSIMFAVMSTIAAILLPIKLISVVCNSILKLWELMVDEFLEILEKISVL